VARGARHYKDAIRQLLTGPLPQASEAKNDAPREYVELGLKKDFSAVLRPNPSNPYDSNAIEVRVHDNLVGHIARTKAAELRRYIGDGVEVDCTIFWNGDPEADYQFFTIQLFPKTVMSRPSMKTAPRDTR